MQQPRAFKMRGSLHAGPRERDRRVNRPGDPGGAGRSEDDPAGMTPSYYFLPSFFFFT